jgi:hypothetical protein
MSENTAAALAVPVQALLPCLEQHCLGDQTTRLLERNEDFANLQWRCHETCSVHHFVTATLNLPISLDGLACGFECKRGRVLSALAHGLEPPETRDRQAGIIDD